jgi:hypothetical protein
MDRDATIKFKKTKTSVWYITGLNMLDDEFWEGSEWSEEDRQWISFGKSMLIEYIWFYERGTVSIEKEAMMWSYFLKAPK